MGSHAENDFGRIFRIFAEFSRKFARKVHEEPYEVGVRFFFCTIAIVGLHAVGANSWAPTGQ